MSDPALADSSSFVTVAQFVVVSLAMLPLVSLERLKKFPPRTAAALVALFFLTSHTNNMAFEFGVSVAAHTVIRSASVIFSAAAGTLFFGEHTTPAQFVLLLGAASGCYFASMPPTAPAGATAEELGARQLMGWAALVLTMVLSVLLGFAQQRAYAAAGPQSWREGTLLSHLLSLPLFPLVIPPARLAARAAAFATAGAAGRLALNAATQVVAIVGVQRLRATAPATAGTLVLTLRKLATVLLSLAAFPAVYAGHRARVLAAAVAVLACSTGYFLLERRGAPAAPPPAAAAAAAAQPKRRGRGRGRRKPAEGGDEAPNN